MLYHKPDKTIVKREEFDIGLNDIIKKDNWIIDGNYQRTLELRLRECDTVFFLDYSLDVCLMGAESRVGKKREDMPWVETELDEDFRQCIIDYPKESLQKTYQLLKKYKEAISSDIVTGKIDVRDIEIPEYEFVEEIEDCEADSEGAVEEGLEDE